MAAGALSIIDNFSTGDTVITVLAFSCFAAAEFLILRIKNAPAVASVCSCVSVLAALMFYSDNKLFIVCFGIIYAVEYFGAGKLFWQISGVAVLIMLVVLKPPPIHIAILLIMLSLLVTAKITSQKLDECRKSLSEIREEAVQLKRKITRLEEYEKTLKQSAAIEERRRFSARIHDKLGHSISGSIILLEAAKLSVRTNPDNAEKCIATVTDNLRSGVDDIRKALREERPDSKLIGISELKEILDSAKAKYGIETRLEIKGDADKITFQIWNCIKENLVEAITNTLKHSKATEFSLTVTVLNKIIRAELRDNGGGSGSFKKSTGLTAIEERTVLAGGKCVFLMEPSYFAIINIFGNQEKL